MVMPWFSYRTKVQRAIKQTNLKKWVKGDRCQKLRIMIKSMQVRGMGLSAFREWLSGSQNCKAV